MQRHRRTGRHDEANTCFWQFYDCVHTVLSRVWTEFFSGHFTSSYPRNYSQLPTPITPTDIKFVTYKVEQKFIIFFTELLLLLLLLFSARMGDRRDTYRMLVCYPKGNRTLGRSRHTSEGIITTYLQKTGWRTLEWSASGSGHVAGSCLDVKELSGLHKMWEISWLAERNNSIPRRTPAPYT